MEDNDKDFIFLKTGWNEAVREVLKILDKKYNKYQNMASVKNDITKLLSIYGNYEKSDCPCEILKYYEKSNYGYIIINYIDKIEGYILDLKTKTYMSMSEVDCLFDINNLEANSIQEFKNEQEAQKELENILSKFKKAEE